MKKTLIEKTSDKLVNAFLKNKLIAPIPKQYSKKLVNAQKFRKLCESKIKEPIVGFKAAGTAIPVMKKLKEKEPFYASIYKRNVRTPPNISVKVDSTGPLCGKDTIFPSAPRYPSFLAPCTDIAASELIP